MPNSGIVSLDEVCGSDELSVEATPAPVGWCRESRQMFFSKGSVFSVAKHFFTHTHSNSQDCLTVILMSYIMKFGQYSSCSSCGYGYDCLSCFPSGFFFVILIYPQEIPFVDQYISQNRTLT